VCFPLEGHPIAKLPINIQLVAYGNVAWLKSSHRAVANCNACHTPANLIGKYATKASNGFWHSFFFTTGGYPDNIQIKPHSREITEQACRNCHGEIVGAIEPAHPAMAGGQLACLRCHDSVGHLH
jgi:cytochrome c nitrite reductase small subunit